MHATANAPTPDEGCRSARTALDAVVDGEADALSVARVESHAAGCADCARALAAARGHRRRLRRLGDTARMPDEARDRVLHLLRGIRGSSSR